jgi:ATP-dependent protease ClpP protease subunit
MSEVLARQWYALSQADNGEAELSIYDEIGAYGIGARQFIDDLKSVKGQHLHLRINSPGGSVTEGTAIFNALRRHEGGLTVHIDALAASMASVVAMAGAPTYIADNALIMVHNPWTITMGDADELRRTAGVLDKMRAALVRAYTSKTGLNPEEVVTLMDDETWLDATEAVALGFADAIEDGVAAAASLKPADLRARFDTWRQAKMTAPESAQASTAPEAVLPPAAPVAAPAPEAPVPVPAAEPQALTLPEIAQAYDAQAAVLVEARQQIEALRGEVTTLRADLDSALAAASEERKANADKLTASALKVAHLETLCGVRGIDPASAVTPQLDPASAATGTDPVTAYQEAVARGDKATRSKLFAEHGPALFAARHKLSAAASQGSTTNH